MDTTLFVDPTTMTENSSALGKNGQSLEQKMPEIYTQLLNVRNCLEKQFRDMCDIEFTVQEGRLFIINVRHGKRTPHANLKFLLQFLSEGKIGIRDVLSRVQLADVEDTYKPQIHNLKSLRYLGQGIPASVGAATGEVVFASSVALQLAQQGRNFVLVKEEVNPEDIDAIHAAQGVVTSRGGMTSHAAIVCRKWSRPCVVGFTQMELRSRTKTFVIPGQGTFGAGKWITVDGTSGRIYAGKGDVSVLRWQNCPELALLAQIIQLGIRGNDVPMEAVGRIWKLRDFFVHNMPLFRTPTAKRATGTQTYISFAQPTQEALNTTWRKLTPIKVQEQENYSTILLTMADTLSRLLSASLGIGNHHRYFRPLWDPKLTVFRHDKTNDTQVVGFEFFGINRHISHLVDVATMTFMLEVELDNEQEEWFLDHTNPNGEGLVTGSGTVIAYQFWLNDAHVSHDDLPLLFHTLRRREYEWQLYQSNNTSHSDIIDFIKSWSNGSKQPSPLMPLCFGLGLLSGHGLTLTGESLIAGVAGVTGMNTFKQNADFANALKEIDRSASAIAERGYDDIQEEWDDYVLHIQTDEFKKLVTFELYEAYFPPQRHEFELHLLTQLVDAVASSKTAEFMTCAVVGGIVGNAAYDVLKTALEHVAGRFSGIRRTHHAVQEIAENIQKIRKYLDKHDDVGGWHRFSEPVGRRPKR
jgi:phosphohistidine swiveling domain-containing protein